MSTRSLSHSQRTRAGTVGEAEHQLDRAAARVEPQDLVQFVEFAEAVLRFVEADADAAGKSPRKFR